jgi:hypothetical protein
MSKLLDVLLLLALPASGKSEVRRYLAHLTPEQCRDEMHMGPTVQLDDYPYVHMMRRVSQALRAHGRDGVFFDSDDLPMKDARDWGTLIELLNEDFDDLVNRRQAKPASPGAWLLERFDRARQKAGADPAFAKLPVEVRASLIQAIEAESADLVRDKNAGIPDSLEGKTVVIEFARGGPRRRDAAAARAARLPVLARDAVGRHPEARVDPLCVGDARGVAALRTTSAPIPTIPARSSTTACPWR